MAGGIRWGRTQDLAVLLHQCLCVCHSAACVDSGAACVHKYSCSTRGPGRANSRGAATLRTRRWRLSSRAPPRKQAEELLSARAGPGSDRVVLRPGSLRPASVAGGRRPWPALVTARPPAVATGRPRVWIWGRKPSAALRLRPPPPPSASALLLRLSSSPSPRRRSSRRVRTATGWPQVGLAGRVAGLAAHSARCEMACFNGRTAAEAASS